MSPRNPPNAPPDLGALSHPADVCFDKFPGQPLGGRSLSDGTFLSHPSALALFPPVDRRCDSFSQWWARTLRGLDSAADLVAVNEVPGW